VREPTPAHREFTLRSMLLGIVLIIMFVIVVIVAFLPD